MQEREISDKEYKLIEKRLQEWTNVAFVEMWRRCARMIFSEEFDTVALEIHDYSFRINANPKFWKRANKFEKIFFICHEFTHLMLGHWVVDPNVDTEWTNIAQDIQVNEFLATCYPEIVKHVRNKEDQAWLSTVFKDKANLVDKGQNYLYYYNVLMSCLK